MRKQSKTLLRKATTALAGLVALLPSFNTGCTSMQRTYDEHGRIVELHEEFDAGKTLSLISLITANFTAPVIPAVALTEEAKNAAKVIRYGSAITSLSRQLRNSPHARVKFEGEPYGFRELESKVKNAIHNPREFIEYLGLDTSGEMPPEVQRLQDFVGEWRGDFISRPHTGGKIAFKVTSHFEPIEGGWLLLSRPLNPGGVKHKIKLDTTQIYGWSPIDRNYHMLGVSIRHEEKKEHVAESFGEGIMRFNSGSGIWTMQAEVITSENYLVKGTVSYKVTEKDMFLDGVNNFSGMTGHYKKVR